jgi:hypothetical protein
MIATGLGRRVLVAFAAFRTETGKLAVNGRRRVQPRMRDRRCGQLSANERTGDFGPSPILVELNHEWRMSITRSLATDQEMVHTIDPDQQATRGAVAHRRRPRWVMERMAIEVRARQRCPTSRAAFAPHFSAVPYRRTACAQSGEIIRALAGHGTLNIIEPS